MQARRRWREIRGASSGVGRRFCRGGSTLFAARYDEPGDQVSQHARSGRREGQNHPDDAHQGDVHIEVMRHAGADAGDLFVALGKGEPGRIRSNGRGRCGSLTALRAVAVLRLQFEATLGTEHASRLHHLLSRENLKSQNTPENGSVRSVKNSTTLTNVTEPRRSRG